MAILKPILKPDWVLWGVYPLLAACLGYYGVCIILEALLQTHWAQKRLLPRKGGRWAAVERDREAIPVKEQIVSATWNLLGPTGLLNAGLSTILLPMITGWRADEPTPIPSHGIMIAHLIVLEILGDLGLYWGHRIQHESDFLWRKFHSKHHRIGTPTPWSTIYIDTTDATLQAGLPVIAAAAVVRPHPITFSVYVFLRIAENVVNHSGLDATVIDVVTLKCIPGRARIAHHDAHHQYSNYGARAKNFGENFWVWDWLFGTYAVGLRHKE